MAHRPADVALVVATRPGHDQVAETVDPARLDAAHGLPGFGAEKLAAAQRTMKAQQVGGARDDAPVARVDQRLVGVRAVHQAPGLGPPL